MMGEAGWVMLVTNQYISVTQGNVLRSPIARMSCLLSCGYVL